MIATFLSLDSKGSKEIKHLYGGYIIQIQLDITDSLSIKNAVQTMEHYFSKNPDYSKFLVSLLTNKWVGFVGFHALINNAGVMVFGEFEWQTEKLMRQQIEVNLLGTFKLTNAFCHLLRQHKGRTVLKKWYF